MSTTFTVTLILQVAVRPGASSQMVAPVTGNSAGLHRAEIHDGVREIITCKDQDGKIGLRIQAVNKVSYSASSLLLKTWYILISSFQCIDAVGSTWLDDR